MDSDKNKVAGLRPVACEKCRNRRSFCTKELPQCARCRDNRLDCVYPDGRKITISESYLKSLEARVRELEHTEAISVSSPVKGKTSVEDTKELNPNNGRSEDDLGVRDVLQGIAVLSFDVSGNQRAQYIEGSASMVLGRRLTHVVGLQSLDDIATGCEPLSHNREALRKHKSSSDSTIRLPPIQVAQRWYDAYYSYIGTIFAFSTREWFDQALTKAYAGPPTSVDTTAYLAYAKVFVILAFGQLYSVNEWNSFDGPPGFELFCHALQYLPEMNEESSLIFVETLALVGYYMQNLDEKEAAFLYIGTALRMAISLALHQEVRSLQLNDAQKEGRRRVWWSVYSMDRILTIKSGYPIMIQDEDIGVHEPSRLSSEPEYGPWIVLRKYTELSKILTRIMHDIYRAHRKSGSNLKAAIQNILAGLATWDRSLPVELRFDIDKLDITRESVSTFLHYYQCINMAVRPLLFLIVEERMKRTVDQRSSDWRTDLTLPTISAVEMCISAAQDTIAMIRIAAQKNLFATYGYMDGEHCFSAALVLVLVCVAFPCTEQDYKTMDSALHMLQSVVGRGNDSMSPRFQLLLQVRSCIVTPAGTKLPELFSANSTESFHGPSLDPMLTSFPQVDNTSMDELWQGSGPEVLKLRDEGCTLQDLNMEYDDLLNWTHPSDSA